MRRIVFQLNGCTAVCESPRGYTRETWRNTNGATARHHRACRDFLRHLAPGHRVIELSSTRLVVEDQSNTNGPSRA